ncbi:FG-GAP repeat domain-containing protein [Nonomuraea sp. GTA35]|uniref:FG-GAP repeat domain-containing protein n=1 Tax=Nonomuraea sp. GTA35 TaxID=1676746 RepID=UPI0035BF6881
MLPMKKAVLAACATLTLTAALAHATTPAHAATPDEPAAAAVTASYATAACDPNGPTGADSATATWLNGVLTAKMRGYMNAYRVSCARMVVKAVRDRGLAPRAAVIAIATTIVEAGIQNVAETVDHDSLGLFQQRASWGSVAQRLNPGWATNAFLDKMIRVYPGGAWKTAQVGEVCQAVQVSAYPDRYQVEAGDAQKIVDALWTPAGKAGADFNGDGIGDIFSAATGTLNVWNGRGSNNFAARQEIGGGWSAFSKPVAGDFNDDGVSDLAAIKGGSTLHIWNGEGGNRFGPAVEIGGGWAPFDGTLTSIGDVNRDGHDDIAAIKDGGTLHVWNGEGGNRFGPAVEIGGGWSAFSKPVGGDFNNDGIGDLAAIKGGSTLHIWNGEGGNRFGPAVEIGGGWARFDGTLTSIGDVNRDGHDDIAAMSDGTLHVWNGEGGNEFGPAIPIGPGWSLYF